MTYPPRSDDTELRRDGVAPEATDDDRDEDERDDNDENDGSGPTDPDDPELRRTTETPEPRDESDDGADEEPDEEPGDDAPPPPDDPELRRGTEPSTDHAVGVASVDEVRAATPDSAADTAADTAAATEAPAAEEPAADAGAAGLLPGAAEAETVVALWDDDTVRVYRERWRELQLHFVDDPTGATGEAQTLVGEAVEAVTTSLIEQRTALDGWRSGQASDTEHLRVALRRYRDLFDRLLDL